MQEQQLLEEREAQRLRDELARQQLMLLREIIRLEREQLKLLEVIAREIHHLPPPPPEQPRLASIRLAFSSTSQRPQDATFWDNVFSDTMAKVQRSIIPTIRTATPPPGASLMPTPGPITLTTAGQAVTASVLGFDQFGNPFTGPIPTPTFSSDDTAGAIVTFDPTTGIVTAVANGVANITASLTTAEGLALTDTEAVTVAIAVVPPPTPVLSSVKVAFA